ncbi:hypothetical protein OFW50_03735 [Lacticaseibacillus chiayiensis]|uniref:Uncharacterized protein n=1 Tax=Lacticaseibacillus chiayiensis TaxID=2100821 RepID=A0ABY6H747_9LACO|nr:hypothetical protein [Lacticaseibacillus chiayiensis]UYN57199.1 hypothetical protein OFW50_03735 [Lacticaseibacillus chiayiensis]
MKYYETEEPFHSLIVANNTKEALNLYREMYGDQDDPEQFKELSREEALYHLTIAKTEDGDIIAYEDVQKSLNEKAPSMLLVDHMTL